MVPKSSNRMDLDAYLDSLLKTGKTQKFPFSMYYTEGAKYANLCQYKTALVFFDNAVQHDPTSVKALLKRSKCLSALQRYDEAIADAKRALDLRPEIAEAVDLIGQAQYLKGDFEGGYLTYLEGRKMKPVCNRLRLGKQLCKDALDNSMHPLRDIKFNRDDVSTIVKEPKDERKFQRELKNRRSVRECFGADMKFMEDLMTDRNLSKVHHICKEMVDYIKGCERFWGTEQPLHTRKKRSKVTGPAPAKPQLAKRQIYICKAAKRRAEVELGKGRTDDCIGEIEMMMTMIESLPKEREKEKMNFMCDAYHLMSLAHKQNKNQNLAFEYLYKELDVAYDFKLRLPKIRAYHRLGESYQELGNIPRAFQCFQGVIIAMDPARMDDLEQLESGDIEKLKEAHRWASSFVSGVKRSLRESIISPVIDSIINYSNEIQSEESKNELSESTNKNRNNMGKRESSASHSDTISLNKSEVENS